MSLPGEPEARSAERRKRGKKYEKALIVLAVIGLLLLAVVQRRLLNLGPGLSSNQGVVTLVSINLSILVLGLLLFLILKGLYRVFFERQAYGSLQTKMVVSFISLSLIPTILIFNFSYRLVGQGGETWFSQNHVEVTRNSVMAAEEALAVHSRIFPALARGALWEFARSAAPGGCPEPAEPAGQEPPAAGRDPGPGASQQGPGSRPRRPSDDYVTLGTLGDPETRILPPPQARAGPPRPARTPCSDDALRSIREASGLSTLEWYGPDGRRLGWSKTPAMPGERLRPLDINVFRRGPAVDRPILDRAVLEGAVLRRLVFPVPDPARPARAADRPGRAGAPGISGTPGLAGQPLVSLSPSGPSGPSRPRASGILAPPPAFGAPGPPAAPLGYLAAGDDGLEELEARLAALREGLAKSEAALGIERPFKVSQLTSLAAVTLLAVFLSVWIGSHLAGSLSAPVTELVEGTRRVAGGDLDFVLTPVHRSGEMADLVAAFNQMTMELKDSYAETDRRRRFAETVLRQVSSGVVVLDTDMFVVDMNQAARDMFRTSPGDAREGEGSGGGEPAGPENGEMSAEAAGPRDGAGDAAGTGERPWETAAPASGAGEASGSTGRSGSGGAVQTAGSDMAAVGLTGETARTGEGPGSGGAGERPGDGGAAPAAGAGEGPGAGGAAPAEGAGEGPGSGGAMLSEGAGEGPGSDGAMLSAGAGERPGAGGAEPAAGAGEGPGAGGAMLSEEAGERPGAGGAELAAGAGEGPGAGGAELAPGAGDTAAKRAAEEAGKAHAAMRPGPLRDLIGPIGAGPPPRGHMRLALADGTTLSLMVDRAPLIGEGGDTLGWLITFDDVTELEKAQRLSAWREVARRIAHEIKNPLTPISLAAQRLRRRFSQKLAESAAGQGEAGAGADRDFQVLDESTEVIIRQVDGMRRLVDEFSQFARLPQADPRPSDITKVAADTAALFREAHPAMDFRVDIKSRPPLFLFDPEQVGRAISNLVSNACRAVRGAGSVSIEIDMDPVSGVEVTVSDDGPGVPPEMRDRIFEPYVTGGEGQGLGLAIVKAIVSDHGGFVRVFDRKPRGTSFTLTLPFREARVA
ncbi:MAG: HAMP domain-containing protein [Deltaproteobacteria bacterium]|jgi:nitrogen fixation/metabolism regulation signal transduction histidine kinase|nr:HAMP domain-containing protein [Deltaproteobacteria bacterium]